MKKKEIKLICFIAILISGFILFLFLILKPYNYQKEYNINNYKIIETYDKKKKYYTFIIEDKETIYPYKINSKYYSKRELIKEIKVYNTDNETCILPVSKNLNFSPLCSKDKKVYSYNLSKMDNGDFKYNELKNVNKEYKNITIHYLDNATYLLYNYRGFSLINEKENKDINLFEKDIYNLELFYEYKEYLIIPNYNKEYYFDELYIINTSNGKLEKITSKFDISFNSVFLGDYKNKIYLLDKQEEKEYVINLKKKKIEETDFQIIENNKLIKKSFKEIKNNLNFNDNKKDINYEIIDNNLFKIINGHQIKISDKNISKIIKSNDENIYYLVKENLYMYNDNIGEVLLMSNFEWNFNYNNMIFIYE